MILIQCAVCKLRVTAGKSIFSRLRISVCDSILELRHNRPPIPQSSLSNMGLRPHGIDAHHGSREINAVKHIGDGGDFIALLFHRFTRNADGVFIDPC